MKIQYALQIGYRSAVSVLWMMLFLLPGSLLSQQTPSLFVVVDFMKVKPQHHGDYLDVEQSIWKPMHQERINQGIIAGWYLYAVEFSGTQDEYNYVVITLYDDAESLGRPWNAELPEKVHPRMELAEIMRRTHDAREHVKSELFYNVITAPEHPLERPAAYMQVNYMHVVPGRQAEYQRLESEIWLPIHDESIRSGRTVAWSLWSSLFPRGSGRPYQYVTLNAFSDYSYVFQLDFSIPFRNIHPDKDFREVQDKTLETRSVVRTELWDLIDYAIR